MVGTAGGATPLSTLPAEPEPPRARPRRSRWWLEVIVLGVLYEIYKATRAAVSGSESVAYRHARTVIRIERDLGIFHEARAQRFLLPHPWFLQLADLYYGTVHFVAPVVVLVLLYRRDRRRYTFWRNVLCLTTGLALLGFIFYPLMPPRFLPEHFHFIDTAARFGGEGILDSGSMKDLDNLYAAMPSLHVAWSTWCLLAAWPVVPGRLGRSLLVAYPLVTLAAVVVTANHYVLDGVGGVATLGFSVLLAAVVMRRGRSTRLRGAATAGCDMSGPLDD